MLKTLSATSGQLSGCGLFCAVPPMRLLWRGGLPRSKPVFAFLLNGGDVGYQNHVKIEVVMALTAGECEDDKHEGIQHHVLL